MRASSVAITLLTLLAALPTSRVQGDDQVTLKSGYQVSGKMARISSVFANPLSPPANSADLIVMIDDELRRVFVPFYEVQAAVPSVGPNENHNIMVDQRVADVGSRITTVGVLTNVEPFDEWGRRTITMQTKNGPIHIGQGITKVTPTYTVVSALSAADSYIWTTKIATSSIPRETLSKILRRQAGEDPDARMRIVQLYIRAERYNDARLEIEEFIKQFPNLSDAKKLTQSLTQASADRLIKELGLRSDAGQHQLALQMAAEFPIENIAGETRIRLGEIVAAYKEKKAQGDRILSLFEKHLNALPDERQKKELQPIRDEIAAELSIHNFDRFADFLRLSEGADLKDEQLLSLAISGWLLGKGESTENLSVAIALFEVRNLIGDYLRSTAEPERAEILNKLESMEGCSPSSVAKLLANMKPAIDTEHDDQNPPGGYEIEIPGVPGEMVKYFVQLPPEYSPYRRYPTIVTLNGALSDPIGQLNWWAGDYDAKRKLRLGQASRRGYIVISPVWTKEGQTKYEFSAREHAAVLFSLRDAQTRFSIDTDRVFLSGFSMGGDAAWDIAMAHPDLWAGVIPIGATVDKYHSFLWPNGKYVPLYYVAGEMDGDRFSRCAVVLDKYLTMSGYDSVVVQYQARGHEHFYDEIQNIFAWMDLHKRPKLVKDFTCVAMRPWDNYFWWLEVDDLPTNLLTLPGAWPPKKGNKTVTEGTIQSPSSILVKTAASRATLYLTPDMINFESKFTIKFNKQTINKTMQPSLSVMLEDVRTRGDRLHLFWQKITVP